MAYVELINQVRSSRTDYTNSAIIGQLWSRTQSKIQEDVGPVNSMQTPYTNPRSYSTLQSLHVALIAKITEEHSDWLHLKELEALDEKRLQAQ